MRVNIFDISFSAHILIELVYLSVGIENWNQKLCLSLCIPTESDTIAIFQSSMHFNSRIFYGFIEWSSIFVAAIAIALVISSSYRNKSSHVPLPIDIHFATLLHPFFLSLNQFSPGLFLPLISLLLLFLYYITERAQWCSNAVRNEIEVTNDFVLFQEIFQIWQMITVCCDRADLCVFFSSSSFLFFFLFLVHVHRNDKYLRVYLIDSNILCSNRITCTCDKDWNIKRNIIFVLCVCMFFFA